MNIAILRVGLGERAYDVRVGAGLVASAGHHLATLTSARRAFVVSESTVFGLHGAVLRNSLQSAGFGVTESVLEPGEGTKSFANLERLCGAMLDGHIERSDVIIAFGGGVIGDLTGFAAGILKRGIDYVQIPTTLLAQVDSSVGGKTAINAPQGKNLVGLFYQPKLVLADTQILNTLPRRELLAGFAEVVKYGLLGDKIFYDWLEAHAAAVVAGSLEHRMHAIVTSVTAKARIVAQDERETGVRALLNLGHTFGHALEAETGYSDRLLHGESVSIGMVLAFQLSERLGFCAPQTADRIIGFLRRVGLPTSPRDVDQLHTSPDILINHMAHDKKARNGRLTLILARAIGDAFVTQDLPMAAIRDTLSDALQ